MAQSDFFSHYINQYINDGCVAELNELSKAYEGEKETLEKLRDSQAGPSKLHEKTFGNKVFPDYSKKLADLDKTCKEKARDIAAKHAEQEGVTLIEWKDPEPHKPVEQKIEGTQTHLNEKQQKLLNMLNMHEENKQRLPEKSLEGKAELAAEIEPIDERQRRLLEFLRNKKSPEINHEPDHTP